MNRFIQYVAVLGIAYIVNSCKPDPIAPIVPSAPAKVNWTLHPATIGKQFITNGLYKDANRLIVVGYDYRLLLDTANQTIQQTHFSRPRSETDRLQPTVNKDFFVQVQDDGFFSDRYHAVKVHSVANPMVFSHIPIRRFGAYEMIFQHKEPACLLTDENKLLIPVSDTTGGLTSYLLKFQLTMRTDSIEYRLEDRIQIPYTTLPWTWATGGMRQANSEEIWANLMATCYKINIRTHAVTPLFPLSDGKFGMIRDTLFAFGMDAAYQNISYNYLPKGQTQWKQFILENVSTSARWYFLENEILAVFHNNYIYHFTVNGNKIQLNRLESEGIEMIKDITVFNGRVYIASLQGLYYKSWKDFWTYTP